MNEKQKTRLLVKSTDGADIVLRAGTESVVKRVVIDRFIPQFAAGSVLVYLKNPHPLRSWSNFGFFEKLGLSSQTTTLPDIILLEEKRGWVFFIEAVHSFGPISPARLVALKALCTKCKLPVVFVTALMDRNAFRKWAPEIAWETEVWIAQEPDHMIHFNGDRFLGPRRKQPPAAERS
jgi:type II restriction enzyme